MDPWTTLQYSLLLIPFVALLFRWLLGLQIVGLTGGIATGKSTASRFLRTHGATVICFDSMG
jgi:hypothetical protein